MGRTKKIINGTMAKISQKTIEYNTIYSFTNMKDGALTGAEMTALLTPSYEGFIAKDSVYWCCESGGAYSEGHFYKFTITGTSPLDNVASWTDLGTLGGGSPADNIIDIGAGQTTIESIVYPTISKDDADEIYLKYVSGQPITLLWGTTGIATHISVIYANDISGYELHCIVHGRVVVYNWTDNTTGNITPTISSNTITAYSHTQQTYYDEGYIKFSNGLMLQWGGVESGSITIDFEGTVTFAQPFSGIPNIFISPNSAVDSSVSNIVIGSVELIGSTSFDYKITRPSGTSGTCSRVHWYAIGRWM